MVSQTCLDIDISPVRGVGASPVATRLFQPPTEYRRNALYIGLLGLIRTDIPVEIEKKCTISVEIEKKCEKREFLSLRTCSVAEPCPMAMNRGYIL